VSLLTISYGKTSTYLPVVRFKTGKKLTFSQRRSCEERGEAREASEKVRTDRATIRKGERLKSGEDPFLTRTPVRMSSNEI
jgi:hypothetical protein